MGAMGNTRRFAQKRIAWPANDVRANCLLFNVRKRGASNIPADLRAHIQQRPHPLQKRRVEMKGAMETCAREGAKRRSGFQLRRKLE